MSIVCTVFTLHGVLQCPETYFSCHNTVRNFLSALLPAMIHILLAKPLYQIPHCDLIESQLCDQVDHDPNDPVSIQSNCQGLAVRYFTSVSARLPWQCLNRKRSGVRPGEAKGHMQLRFMSDLRKGMKEQCQRLKKGTFGQLVLHVAWGFQPHSRMCNVCLDIRLKYLLQKAGGRKANLSMWF